MRALVPALLLLSLPSSAAQLVPGSIAFHSPAGQALLQSGSTELGTYFALAEAYTTQVTQSFCSLATAVIILNALNQTSGVLAPTGGPYAPYPYFTQEDVFSSPCVRTLPTHVPGTPFSAAFLAAHGATLDEWQSYVSCFASASATHAASSSAAALRTQLQAALGASPPRYLGVNYQRSALGQAGGGHMSPVAAYDPGSDLVLVLDVARYRASVMPGYGPLWVPLPALFASMNTTDSDSGVSRGWLEVAAPRGSAPPLAPAPPPFNFTIGRGCLAALADANDLDGVEKCMRGGPLAPAPPPPPASLAPACVPSSGSQGVGGLAVVTFLLAVSTTGLGTLYWRERKGAAKAARGGAACEPDGVLMLPR